MDRNESKSEPGMLQMFVEDLLFEFALIPICLLVRTLFGWLHIPLRHVPPAGWAVAIIVGLATFTALLLRNPQTAART